jgi:hypothetical protein
MNFFSPVFLCERTEVAFEPPVRLSVLFKCIYVASSSKAMTESRIPLVHYVQI